MIPRSARFDAYEMNPVVETRIGNQLICEAVLDGDCAEEMLAASRAGGHSCRLSWTVYGHIPGGGVEAIEDFDTEQEASRFFARLISVAAA